MITVEIEVPVIGKQYDFRIDEDALLFRVREEIVGMICQKEQCCLSGSLNRLVMWNAESKRKLEPTKSVQENGLLAGSRLLLI